MNLFIGNLSPDTTQEDLRTLFSEFGVLVSAKVVYDNETGMPRGFGFVEMEDKFHAFDAIDNIDCTYFKGNIISVKESKPKNGGGNNRGGGGFNRGGGMNRGGGGNYNRSTGGSRPAYSGNRTNNNYGNNNNTTNNNSGDNHNRL